MKPLLLGVSCVGMLLAGCASVDSRVSHHQAAFNSWPAEVQQKVKAGQIDLGYSTEMVQVALGDPDRRSSRTTAAGVADVWIYFDKGPKFSFGIGMGTSSRHGGGGSSMGGGVVVGDNSWRDEEMMRVVFAGGRVTAIERRR